MNSRRAFLGILGAGAVGGVAIGYGALEKDEAGKDGSDTGQQNERTPTETEVEEEPRKYEQALKTANESLIVESVQHPDISFDYDPIRTNIGDSEPLLERVEAVPLDGNLGDTLRIFPSGERQKVTDYFTAILGTRIREQVFSINGAERTFASGQGAVPFFIWGGEIEGKSQILVGRGENRTVAEAAVQSFESDNS